jgi:hypothetical protein
MARSSSSRLSLIVAALSRCGGAAGTACAPTPPWPGGPKSGRRRPSAHRPLEGPLGDRQELRRCWLSAILARRYPRAAACRPGALRAPLKT